MIRITLGAVVLLATVPGAGVLAAAEAAGDGAQVSSSVDVKAGAVEAVAAMTGARAVQAVEAALRADPRTADLGVMVSVDDRQVIGLHGLVPSKQARAAAERVATKVATPWRVRSHLSVPRD